MHPSPAHKELNQLIKASTDEDTIWLLHLMNKDNEEHRYNSNISDTDDLLNQSTINILNTLKNSDEIRKVILDNYVNINERSVFNFIDSIKRFKETLNIRAKDLSDYKSNKRLLYFTLYSMSSDRALSWHTVCTIQNDYFRFLYMLFISPSYSRSNRLLNGIEERFSKVLSKNPIHFKNFDSDSFYLWAKGYMDQDKENSRVHNSSSYKPLDPKEYNIVINAIFDSLLDKDANIYKAIKIQLSNAWYQKRHREKNKGRKHHYYLTDKALLSLEILAKKHDITKEKMIESLVNERYTKECMDNSGNHLYSV
ncbi:hypothetical protein QTA56_06800 [Acinetobacter sp. VNH17]|uniref:Uncharacterized protein n=1 Tax=Acinetobacter thutiue TaxID=2998078 RepID=A0ABT7WMN2_9GAMM|nr:hypothetical protein [Acinetobacter thutiue]MCY6411846.1 hypothetical protein [Acinetobacter thutiue]MDN0013948.1 hypothetical protein [Acinetobacter thutiue]